ncbi:MAG TPA: 2-amino-4-hydroxy-6-hydroxymethyldihydropteridine diphosphokinase [Candidatus Peribacterales bacterium]|nr:2-amino-4-hydroxy-6-hydroxymethyldihydropteridine diphosphokinase [Candidatus Peribacterales bacterium]
MIVSIALGSNIDASQNMRSAAMLLRERFSTVAFSPVYRTKAMEVENQEDFLNAVCRIETEKSAEDLLENLETIERTLKKNPPYRYGPRTIDLDLLLYGGEIIHTPRLIVPHPKMEERRFVLEPLLTLIDPESMHPSFDAPWSALKKKTMNQECHRIDLIL